MPKAGPPHPVTDEWREALTIRLRELGWTHQDLAEKVGATRASISHLIAKGVQSSLVPEIEGLVGWDRQWAQTAPPVSATTTLPSSVRRSDTESQQTLQTLQTMLTAPDQLELLSRYQRLSAESRARLLERARVLCEDEDMVAKKKAGTRPAK